MNHIRDPHGLPPSLHIELGYGGLILPLVWSTLNESKFRNGTEEAGVQVENNKQGLEIGFSGLKKFEKGLYTRCIPVVYTDIPENGDIQVKNVKIQSRGEIQVFGSKKYMKRADIHADIH